MIHTRLHNLYKFGLLLSTILAAALLLAALAGSAGSLAAPARAEETPDVVIQSRPPDQTLVGERAGSLFGYAVAGVGDVNGDGYDDVLIGAPKYDTGLGGSRGKVYLYYGGPDGPNPTPAFTRFGAAESQFGYAIAGAGDVNHDGYADVVVGAPYMYNGSDPVGQMALYIGGPDGLAFDFAHSDFAAVGSCLGWAVAGPGDLDGDGYDDVLAGDICHATSTGRVLVYHGSSAGLSSPPTTILPGHQEYAFFGIATAGAGDVNGDGHPDVVIGERGYEVGGSTREGRAYVYHGGPEGLNVPADTIFTGQRDDSLGCAVAGGDLNGDAYSDILIGAHYSLLSGKAYGYRGSSSGVQSSPVFSATRSSGEFGTAVALPGDLTGDGYSDTVVGAYGEDEYTGAALLYGGSAAGLSATPALTLTGEHPNDSFGYAVAPAGDVNGDGYPDLIIGAPYYSYNEDNAVGKVYIYYGGALTGLTLRKSVTPVYSQPGMPLTYTITLRNNDGDDAPGLALTDTLPLGVTFTHWGEHPAGAGVADGQLTWQGTLTANTVLTFTFGIMHTLQYGQAATNVVSYTQGTIQGSSAATFYVWHQVYLPLVVR
ncbi:MAG: FG-GAP repeat protein [Chloroflexi bacterium]|nr:FG-GAP repeat protein [Chloroflexota bacterium]